MTNNKDDPATTGRSLPAYPGHARRRFPPKGTLAVKEYEEEGRVWPAMEVHSTDTAPKSLRLPMNVNVHGGACFISTYCRDAELCI